MKAHVIQPGLFAQDERILASRDRVPACFVDCSCSCGTTYDAFDRVAADELRELLRLENLCRPNIGWYTGRSPT